MWQWFYLFPETEYSLEKISLRDSEYRSQNVLQAVMAIFREGFSSSLSQHSTGAMWPPRWPLRVASTFAAGTLSPDMHILGISVTMAGQVVI